MRPPRDWKRTAAFGLIGACLLLTGTAGAAPTWLPPQTLVADASWRPQVAVDPDGNSVAVWIQSDGTNYWVESSSRAVGGIWSTPPQRISATPAPEEFKCELCLDPQVAMDSTGRAVAVWSFYNNSLMPPKRQIVTKSRAAGAPWPSIGLIISTRPSARAPRLAVARSGAAAVVWSLFDNVNTVVDGRTRPVGASSWSAEDPISPRDADSFGQDVAVASDGTAVAVWHTDPLPAQAVVQAAVKGPSDAGWSSPVPLSAAGGFDQSVAMNGDGTAVAVWAQIEGSGTRLRSSVRPPGGPWGPSQPASGLEAGGIAQQVGVDGSGNAVAVWLGADGSNQVVKAATRPAGAATTWSEPAILSRRGEDSTNPDLAVNAAGDAVVVWSGGVPSASEVQAVFRPRGGTWSAPQPLSPTDTDAGLPAAAIDSGGNALAAWRGRDGSNDPIRSATLDAEGPVFTGLSVPANGEVGQAVAFSVSPSDKWSALGPGPIWTFGDGASAVGTNVAHAYGALGSYTVTVTQADTVGNSSSESRTVSISQAPPPPPPPPPPPGPPPPRLQPRCVVPKVVGKRLTKAKAAIRKAKCRTGNVRRRYAKRRKGLVISQTPKAGRRLVVGARVHLVLSRGVRPRKR